jgi:tripartite-type tricarboxylate transporter receptor subunit TctC
MGGAGGSIGTATAARAEPDGKTLLLGGTSDIIINPVIMDRVAESKSLVPIAMLANTVSSIVVNPAIPAKNLAELVAFVKANPGKLSYASSGTGTVAHLGGELFKRLAGMPDLIHVPYRGTPPLLADLSAGHVSIGVTSLVSSMIDLHKEGKIRILATASERRSFALPEVPTAAESGYPKLVAVLFLGLFAPAGIPAPVMQQLSDLSRQIAAEQKFQDILVNQGLEPVLNSGPDEAAKFVREEYERWEPLVRSLGLKG